MILRTLGPCRRVRRPERSAQTMLRVFANDKWVHLHCCKMKNTCSPRVGYVELRWNLIILKFLFSDLTQKFIPVSCLQNEPKLRRLKQTSSAQLSCLSCFKPILHCRQRMKRWEVYAQKRLRSSNFCLKFLEMLEQQRLQQCGRQSSDSVILEEIRNEECWTFLLRSQLQEQQVNSGRYSGNKWADSNSNIFI